MVTQDGLVRLGSRVFSAEEGIPQHEYENGEFEPRTGRDRGRPSPTTPRPPPSTTRQDSREQRRHGQRRAGRAGARGVRRACSRRTRSSVMNTFGPPKRVFVRGEGCYVWDADGRRHLDLLAGIAVNALGHAHPTVLAAVTGQISTLGHVSNFFATPAQVALATRLAGLTGDPDAKVFFTNSGTEANEAAFKITRMTGRTKIISTEGAFHGRSMGALAITHNPKYRAPFEPLPGDVTFVPYGDVEALAAVVDETVAAVVLEPIQGENGVIVPPEGYLARARELCDAAGALLWIDEVQTGMGRTGSWLVHTAQGVRADVVTRGQGSRQRLPGRGLPGHRAGRPPARPGQPRLDLRRQPGRRRSPGWP